MMKPKKWWKRKRLTIPLGSFLFLMAFAGGMFSCQPKFLLHELADLNPEVLFYVETEQKALALTIDDAPSRELSPAVLDLLEKHNIKATFFIIGNQVSGNEDLIARMKADGHELGNHLVADVPSISLSDEEFRENLLAVEKLIGPLGPTKWCRPASGWFTSDMVEIAADLGYRLCLGSLYPFDNQVRNAALLHQAVMARVSPGAVLILHEGGSKRDYVLPLLEELIPDLLDQGYSFLTVSQLQALQQDSPSLPDARHP